MFICFILHFFCKYHKVYQSMTVNVIKSEDDLLRLKYYRRLFFYYTQNLFEFIIDISGVSFDIFPYNRGHPSFNPLGNSDGFYTWSILRLYHDSPGVSLTHPPPVPWREWSL